jgi:HEAT repeat protein
VFNTLTNLLLNVRPGERRRLLVLYLMLFTFSNGITWGGSIAEAAFMNLPGLGVPALPLIIIADAVVSVLAIIIYTAFVDRIPNDKLLVGLLVGFAVTIAAGRILIDIQQPVAAYILLFVVYRASDSIFLLHWWTYVSEFYDIRAFKRLAPVILSAKTLGIMTSGATLPLLNQIMNPADIIALWLVAMLVIILINYASPFIIKGLSSTRRSIHRGTRREPFVRNIREGYRYVRKSTYLGWFAVGSLALAVGAALFQSISSQVIQATYPDQTGYANFLGVMNTVGGLITFPLQLFLINRIINRIGVGNAMMMYPVSMGVSSAALLLLPPMVLNAALGVLNRSVFRLAFRAPVMGLVYNVVPHKVRGRARAFVSGLVEPVGAVLGSLALLFIPPPLLGLLLAVCVGGYVFATLAARQLYSLTLVDTLHDEEYSASLDSDAVLTADPDLVSRLKMQLPASATPDEVFFNTRLLLEAGGGESLPTIQQTLDIFSTETEKQLAVLNAVISTQTAATEIYLTFIGSEDERLREAAIDGLEEIPQLAMADFALLYGRMLSEPNPALQARLIPILIRSKNYTHSKGANDLLRTYLTGEATERILLGLNVVKDSRYLPQITALLQHEDDRVRLGAVAALESFTRQGISTGLSINHLDDLQHDPVERIRELALSILSQVDDPESPHLILNGFRDPSPQVQKRAAEVLARMGSTAVPLLTKIVNAPDGDLNMRKLAAAALSQVQPRRHNALVESQILLHLGEIHQNDRQIFALSGHQYSQGIRILSTTLQEQNRAYIDDIFYLLTAVGGAHTAQTLREALESDSSVMRSGAIEALESLVSPETARVISALFDGQSMSRFTNTTDLKPAEALRQLITDQDDSWLRAAAVFALGDLHGVFTEAEREELLKRALNDSYADVRQAARAAQKRLKLNGRNQEQGMVSLIERIMFLKQVSIFQSIPLEPLKAIASVCEPEFYSSNTTIFEQGEASGGLYVVTGGQVAIEVKSRQTGHIRLATLGVNAYFGEMSLFNNRPRSASALALQDTDLLKLSRVSFIRLVRQFPDMSLTLLDVLSQRLAEVNEQLAEK